MKPAACLPNPAREVLGLVQIYHLALGLGRDTFARRTVRRDLRQHGVEFLRIRRGETAAAHQIAKQPVHDQAGVAADRGGEVRVGRARQPEVTNVVGSIDRLLHAAQQDLVEHALLGPPAQGLDEVGEKPRRGFEGQADLVAEPSRELGKCGEFLFDGASCTR